MTFTSTHSPRTRRSAGAVLAAALFGPAAVSLTTPDAAHAYTYNCVNVVLRDPFWGQYRRVIESGSNAAGVAPALGRAGFAVDGVPSVGAVMSWPPGYYGASSVGHVGVVTAVNANGSVVVLHENWPYGSAAHLQTFPLRPGYQFVHRPNVAAAHVEEEEAEVA